MNLKTQVKINLLLTFILRFVTQNKLSLILIETLYFRIKQPIFQITQLSNKMVPSRHAAGTSPEGPLKVLRSGTSMGPSGDS